MNRLPIFIVCLWGLTACAKMPEISISPDQSKGIAQACRGVFPTGDWQFLHTVETNTSGGKKSVLMGVTVIYSRLSKIHSVLMTVDGMVLFDAEYDREITIHRSVAPFDSQAFAQGIMDDIRFMFSSPSAGVSTMGTLADGAQICRYGHGDGAITDVIITESGAWQLKRYDASNRLIRQVEAGPSETAISRFPRVMELTAQGLHSYGIKMTLVNATPIQAFQ